jgi:hypothetical protein
VPYRNFFRLRGLSSSPPFSPKNKIETRIYRGVIGPVSSARFVLPTIRPDASCCRLRRSEIPNEGTVERLLDSVHSSSSSIEYLVAREEESDSSSLRGNCGRRTQSKRFRQSPTAAGSVFLLSLVIRIERERRYSYTTSCASPDPRASHSLVTVSYFPPPHCDDDDDDDYSNDRSRSVPTSEWGYTTTPGSSCAQKPKQTVSSPATKNWNIIHGMIRTEPDRNYRYIYIYIYTQVCNDRQHNLSTLRAFL